jgi:N6-adenosine-specific RNA methylase IME4
MIDLRATPQAGGYSVVLADPPWHHASRTPKGQTNRSPSHHYRTMSLPEIAALPVADVAARDCHLFLWTTGPHLEQSFSVIRSWGFRYSSLAFVWVKRKKSANDNAMLFMDMRDLFTGMGYTTRQNVEVVLLGRRGKPQRLSKSVHQVIVAPRREHSRKPAEAHGRIETYCPGPRLEMFSRERRVGWDAWGDEADKFERMAA